MIAIAEIIRHCYECDEVLIRARVLEEWAWICPRGCAEWWINRGKEEEQREAAVKQARRERILRAVGGRYTDILPLGGGRKKGGGSKSGRRRKKPLKAKRWYQE